VASDDVHATTIRCRQGVPFTLGNATTTTTADYTKCYSYVTPYPSVADTQINAVDLVMGYDGVLWVLDIGVTDTLGARPCRKGVAKIIGFDVAAGKVNDKE